MALKWIRYISLTLFSLLLIALVAGSGAFYWLTNTQDGMRWGLGQASGFLAKHTKQTLLIEAPKGNLWNGFSLQSFSWSNGSTTVSGENLTAKVNWPELRNGLLDIQSLQGQKLSVVVKPTEPQSKPGMPASIDLPFKLRLNALNLESFQFDKQTMHNVSGKADWFGHRLQIHRLALRLKHAALQTAMTLQMKQPYQIQGMVSFNRNFDGLKVDGKVDASGSLNRLKLSVDALGQDKNQQTVNQTVNLQALLTPFESLKVQNIEGTMTAFNPHQWLEQAPKAKLNVKVRLQPNAQLTEGETELSVQNANPIALEKGGIPIKNLSIFGLITLKNQLPDAAQLTIKKVSFADGKNDAGSLSGSLKWQAAKDSLSFEKDTLQSSLKLVQLKPSVFADVPPAASLSGTLDLTKQGSKLSVENIDLQDGKSQVAGSVFTKLTSELPIQLNLEIKNVNPARYTPKAHRSRYLEGNLNGQMKFEGVLHGAPKKSQWFPAGLVFAHLQNSRLSGAPFALKVDAKGNVNQFTLKSLDLNVVNNQLKAAGEYGDTGSAINFTASLEHLAELGKLLQHDLQGSIVAKGQLTGHGEDLRVRFDAQAKQLKWANQMRLKELQAKLNIGFQADSPWEGNVRASGLSIHSASSGDMEWIDQLRMKLDGTYQHHALEASWKSELHPFSRRRALSGEFDLQGGLKVAKPNKALPEWQGQIKSFKIEGLWRPVRSLSLVSPVDLLVSKARFHMGALQLAGEDDTRIDSQMVSYRNKTIETQGQISAITLPRLSPIFRRQMSLEPKNLKLKAKWSYKADPKTVDGHVDVNYLSGDLQVLEDSEIEVGIKQMQAVANFNRQAFGLTVNMQADQFGDLQANLTVPVSKDPVTRKWHVSGKQPISGSVAASFTQMQWLGPLINPAVRTSGSGQVALAIGGTVDRPQVEGRVFARAFNVFELDSGTRLEDGTVTVDLNNDRAKIEDFDFTVYNRQVPRRRIEELGGLIQGTGKVTASGQWNLNGLGGEVDVKADRATLLQRPDRWMMLNGQLQINQPVEKGQPLKVRGNVNALGAYIETPEKTVETLDSDVYIQGRTQSSARGGPVDVQVKFNLGPLFYLNAQGLRTRLSGGLQLVMQDGLVVDNRRSGRKLVANGTIQAVDGTYRAYGQDLTIDRGVVNFQGPLDNPGLNVRAVRKGVAVEAGVEITGSAQRPQITLVSDPAVPDSEKLSWMITGRGSNASDRDSTILLTAAAAIFGDDDDSTTRKIAKSLGIDDFTLSTGSLTAADSRGVGSRVAIAPGADESAAVSGADDPLLSQRIISLGKRLSKKVYLSFDQSVTTAANILKLNYQYDRRLSFIARAGADNAVDFLYQFSFD